MLFKGDADDEGGVVGDALDAMRDSLSLTHSLTPES